MSCVVIQKREVIGITVAGVDSFNGRTAAVLPEAGDYTASQIDFNGTLIGSSSVNVQDVIGEISPELQQNYYVSNSGNDANDGLTPGTAKRTLAFVDSLKKYLGTNVNVSVSTDIYSADTVRQLRLKEFYGFGSITIIGVETDVLTGLVATSWQNTISAENGRTFIGIAGGLTANAHKGQYVRIVSGTGSGSDKYPIRSNTTNQVEVTNLPNIDGTTTFNIVKMSKLIGEAVTNIGVKVNYSEPMIEVNTNNVSVTLENLDITDILTYLLKY